MLVHDLIQHRQHVYSISEESTTHDAARYLRHHQLRAVGVLDTGGNLVGVLSQSDISDKVAAENKCPAWMKVSEIMTRSTISVGLEATLDECVLLMEKNGIFHLLVIDEKEGFRGMISVQDLLRILANNEKERADLLEAMMFPQH